MRSRLFRPLLEADHPPAPLELRRALGTIDRARRIHNRGTTRNVSLKLVTKSRDLETKKLDRQPGCDPQGYDDRRRHALAGPARLRRPAGPPKSPGSVGCEEFLYSLELRWPHWIYFDSIMAPGLRINVGCGLAPTEGWINLDSCLTIRLAQFPAVVQVATKLRFIRSPEYADLAREGKVRFATATHLPFQDGDADIVYSSHMFEHLDRSEARIFLREARRVLRAGGVLRLAVPDLRLLVDDYLASGDADRIMERSYLGKCHPRGFRERLRALVLGDTEHMWMYDGASLLRLVKSEGFVDGIVLPAGESTIENSGSLNLHERDSESVYVEARRP